MDKTFTCINCPIGCQLTVQIADGKAIAVTGNACARGIVYAKQEAIAPTRMVTAVVHVPGCDLPLSVKTASPIPKAKIFDCMQEIQSAPIKLPVRIGDVVCKDVCGTGIDVVSTRDLS